MAKRKYKAKAYGNCSINYIYAVCGSLNSPQEASFQNGLVCPTWNTNTEFRIDFKSGLVAGNASIGDQPPTEWNIYRRRTGDPNLYLAATLPGTRFSFVDYGVSNKQEYTYYVYPSNTYTIGSPVETESIKTNWPYWTLIVADSTDVPDHYKMAKIFVWQYNNGDAKLQTNTTVNVLNNFTEYPKIQRDNGKALSGSLSALLGTVDCSTGKYTETLDELDEFYALANDKRHMFLRDVEGHFFEVKISGNLSTTRRISPTGEHTKELEWTQISAPSLSLCVTD